MAIRPNNLTPRSNAIQKPVPTTQPRAGDSIVQPPTVPDFGGAQAVIAKVGKAPYGTIAHVGRNGGSR